MEDTHLLVTLYNNNGSSFILKLSVGNNLLKLIITEKSTAEKWKCAYDASYIENLTRKTGNFKQFAVFVSMLKAGLLKTNDCVYVELLTQEDLESRRKKPSKCSELYQKRRKYLILIYQVEFDKIHYPLPLDYSGAPDPSVLQSTIRRYENEIVDLKAEVSRLKSKNKHGHEGEHTLKELVCHLNKENQILYAEVNKLKNEVYDRDSNNENKTVQKLELQLKKERSSFKEKLHSLEMENKRLIAILAKLQRTGRVPVIVSCSSHGSRSPSRTPINLPRRSKVKKNLSSTSGSTTSIDSRKIVSKTSLDSVGSTRWRTRRTKTQGKCSDTLNIRIKKSPKRRSISAN